MCDHKTEGPRHVNKHDTLDYVNMRYKDINEVNGNSLYCPSEYTTPPSTADYLENIK